MTESARSARSGRGGALLPTLLALAPLLGAVPAEAQYTIRSPSGREISFTEAEVREMLERSREFRRTMEEDPTVLYYVAFGDPATDGRSGSAYPWRAVSVLTDTTLRVTTPGDLREGARAYYNYSALLMRHLRDRPPPAGCDAVMEREVERVSAFVDGWVAARTLFGGPAHPPLDAFVFARADGMLAPMLVAVGDTRLGGCAGPWKRSHPDELERYRDWYRTHFVGSGEAGEGA